MNKLNIRYVDMAIYVDEHILDKEPHTQEVVYDYLVHLAYMLILKHRFFSNNDMSEQYAHYLATDVYMRMTTPRQFLPETDSNYLTPIISCLNYMKLLLYPRKVAFAQKEFGYTTKADDAEAAEVTRRYMASPLRNDAAELRRIDLASYIESVPKTLLLLLKKSVYGNDKVTVHYLYNSVLLSFIRNITFSDRQVHRLNKYKCPDLTQKFEQSIKQYYDANTVNAPITYGLNEEFETFVSVYLQKFKKEIATDIKQINADYDVTDDVIEDVIMSNLNEVLDGDRQ